MTDYRQCDYQVGVAHSSLSCTLQIFNVWPATQGFFVHFTLLLGSLNCLSKCAQFLHRPVEIKTIVGWMWIEDSWIEIVLPWLIRGSIEVYISQEKPVILCNACPGRLLIATYELGYESEATRLKSRCTHHSSQYHGCSREVVHPYWAW